MSERVNRDRGCHQRSWTGNSTTATLCCIHSSIHSANTDWVSVVYTALCWAFPMFDCLKGGWFSMPFFDLGSLLHWVSKHPLFLTVVILLTQPSWRVSQPWRQWRRREFSHSHRPGELPWYGQLPKSKQELGSHSVQWLNRALFSLQFPGGHF